MLYRFSIELSDIDRGVYETLDFRISQHQSEIAPYLLSRVLAYALSYQVGLQFNPGGLSDPEGPALQSLGVHGTVDVWIEIGNPSARKLHKATKTARQVIVYTYKSPEVLMNDIKINDVHRAREIQIYAFDPNFLKSLEALLEKNNRWSALIQDGNLEINSGPRSFSTEVKKFSLP